jgi:hypothetical protein
LLFLVAAPALNFSPLPRGSLAVNLAVTESSIPDGFPQLRDIRFDPQAVELRYRRIDGSLRPWQRLTTPAHAVDLSEGDDIRSFSFGALGAGYGATYELSLAYADALSWLTDDPSPRPGEFSDILHIWSMGSALCTDTSAAATISAARTSIMVITVPSQPVATPDLGLRAVQRSFGHRSARVIRGAPIVFSEFASPHACGYSTALKIGDRVDIASVDRDPISSTPTETSVGPLGVPAAAAIPSGTPRMVFQAIRVELSSVPFRGEAQTRELIFASPGELREYLAPQ